MITIAAIDAELARRKQIAAIDAELARRGIKQPIAQQPIAQQPIAQQPIAQQPISDINNIFVKSMGGNTGLLPDQVNNTITGVGEVAIQMAGNLAALGIGGIQMLLPDKIGGGVKGGQETIKSITSLVAPRTAEGNIIGEQVQSALAQINKIPAGWAGIASLLGGNDINTAVDTIHHVEKVGLPTIAGDIVLKKTGSPLLATIVKISPTIAGLLLPIKSIGTKIATDFTKARKAEAITKFNNIENLKSGDVNNLVEDFKLVNADNWKKPTKVEVKVMADKLNSDPAFAEQYIGSLPQIEKIQTAKKALKQEWDTSVLALVKSGTLQDVKVMERQLEIYKSGVKKLMSKIGNRPIFESGKALNEQIKFLLTKKNEAGKRVSIAAKKLKGQKLNFEPIVDGFIKNLQDEGVIFNNGKVITNLTDYNKIDFRRSLFSGSKGSEDILINSLKRMTTKDYAIDAFDLHNLKQSLPHSISATKAAKSSGGLIPKAELALNDLRRNINTLLKNNSTEYKKANEDFAKAIDPLNSLNDAMPINSQIQWDGINPDKAGLQSRKILSNYSSAIDMADSIAKVGKVTKELGGNFNQDPVRQSLFAIQLDKRLGAFADQTFQGIQESAQKNVIGSIPTSLKDVGKIGISIAMKKIKKVDNAEAIKAMESFLKEIKASKRFETKTKTSTSTNMVNK